jgi:glycosyltransferase involved in cell wall biosynthesis
MRALPQLTILLSTYNGERYLPSQLESFLGQTDVDWRLCWRDDGSGDQSRVLIEEFARGAGAGRCVESRSSGTHLGAAASFLQLLTETQDSPFIAFADQDDYWPPDKLVRGLRLIGDAAGAPTLYCARQMLTDDRFFQQRPSFNFGSACRGFPASLTQNIATGNTVVINEAAARLISAIPHPEASLHDWWSYIVVSACGGRVIYDPEPAVLYRQHAGNLIGSSARAVSRASAALRRGRLIYMTMMRRHAERLSEYRELLTPQAAADLQVILTALNGGLAERIAALRCPSFRRATLGETMLFHLWFLTHPAPEMLKNRDMAMLRPTAILSSGTKARRRRQTHGH